LGFCSKRTLSEEVNYWERASGRKGKKKKRRDLGNSPTKGIRVSWAYEKFKRELEFEKIDWTTKVVG
jgi:hypothetical protein